MRAEVDARLGVLDHRAVLDVGADLEPAHGLHLDDVLDGLFADDGVGPHPESRAVVRHALVQDVLDVGGGAGQALDPGRGPAE